jgi:hypothetical protein
MGITQKRSENRRLGQVYAIRGIILKRFGNLRLTAPTEFMHVVITYHTLVDTT